MSELIKVALDAMGGDNAPGEIVKGAVDAVNRFPQVKVILVGQEAAIKQALNGLDFPADRIEIKNADEIIVMDEGRIVERGRHEELIALDGYYKKLNDMQAL